VLSSVLHSQSESEGEDRGTYPTGSKPHGAGHEIFHSKLLYGSGKGITAEHDIHIHSQKG
jgi:hypothetical protein